MPKFAFTGRQASGSFLAWPARFGSWVGNFGISGCVGFCRLAWGARYFKGFQGVDLWDVRFLPCHFKFSLVAAFGVSGWVLVILLGGQCHKLFLGLR